MWGDVKQRENSSQNKDERKLNEKNLKMKHLFELPFEIRPHKNHRAEILIKLAA